VFLSVYKGARRSVYKGVTAHSGLRLRWLADDPAFVRLPPSLGFGVASKVCDKVEEFRAGDTLGANHPSHRPKPHKHWRLIGFDPSQQPSQSVPHPSQRRVRCRVSSVGGRKYSPPAGGVFKVLPATKACLQGFCEFLKCYRSATRCYRGTSKRLRRIHFILLTSLNCVVHNFFLRATCFRDNGLYPFAGISSS
jgi:hypothetical protein